jgi:hypothetical protein
VLDLREHSQGPVGVPDGGYWTGWQYANQEHFPDEQSSWTAAAMILAADTLSRTTPGSGLFRDLPAAWPRPAPAPAADGARTNGAGGDAGFAACGCPPPG